METVIEAVEPVAAAHDMSMFALFMQADWVVKSVMLGLLFASIACWAVIFAKAAAYARARREMKAFDKIFASGEPLSQIYARLKDGPRTGLGALFAAAMEEWNGSHAENAANSGGLQARLRIVLDTTVAAESEKLDRSLSLLATVGSAAPFVGLFGTVWGIMNAFTSIAAAKSTSLAVVAPGIAEALFATALGLLAAIPAVIAYNKLSGDAGRLIGRLEAFADRVSVLLSRQLDARGNA
ncbi:protein TolQ [Devosia sp. Root105]|uniref:protein TolQ n=1 Tax=Devosia sp. Root105 TaxID=1736423 RepID=UPI0006F8CB9E|nr:protein TolQ [Devosia sp. Root105]KQU94215.1 protein TolQ [Devosia sp. Root105]